LDADGRNTALKKKTSAIGGYSMSRENTIHMTTMYFISVKPVKCNEDLEGDYHFFLSFLVIITAVGSSVPRPQVTDAHLPTTLGRPVAEAPPLVPRPQRLATDLHAQTLRHQGLEHDL
jgi:hypothetical protein